jgi:hypothetical protein
MLSKKQAVLLLLVSCLVFSSALKIWVIHSSEIAQSSTNYAELQSTRSHAVRTSNLTSAIKLKGKVIPGLNYGHRPEDVCGSGCIGPAFLTSALGGGDWLASRPCRFTPGGTASRTHCIGGEEGYRADVDVMERREKSLAITGFRTP